MGIKPPREKFKIPDRINGIAMQAFAAGRVESVIRRTPEPVTYVDFHAQVEVECGFLASRFSA
jgi:hypothetical protein